MYTKPRKFALKCHRCNRVGHRVKDCTIPKRKKEQTGSTKVLGITVPKPVQIRQITSVWDEFPDIARPERASHVTSVWDQEPEQTEVQEGDTRYRGESMEETLQQQGNREESPRGEESSSAEKWFDSLETQIDWEMGS